MIRRVLLVSSASIAALLASAAPVLAHIDPDPTEAQAGSTLTVGFTVEHGCDGSPTVQLDMRLPEGVTNVEPMVADGWEGSIDGEVVTFTGGPLADDVEGTFSVLMTLPPTPDSTIFFPFVQRCEVDEIRWIGIPDEPGEELDEPAPAMLLTGPVAAPTVPATSAPAADPAPPTAPSDTQVPPDNDDASRGTVVASPDTVVAATTEPVAIAPASDDSSDSDTGTIFFVVTMVVVLGLGVLVYFRARSARNARGNSSAG